MELYRLYEYVQAMVMYALWYLLSAKNRNRDTPTVLSTVSIGAPSTGTPMLSESAELERGQLLLRKNSQPRHSLFILKKMNGRQTEDEQGRVGCTTGHTENP